MEDLGGTVVRAIVLVCIISAVHGSEGSEKCFRDEDVGDRKGNVYYCTEPDKPECCYEEGLPSCCENKEKKMLREQLTLWGSLAAVVLVLSVAICFFWKDINCCRDNVSLKEKYCRCCTKKLDDEKDLTPIPEPGPACGSSRPWSSTLEDYPANYYNRESPAPPPFRYK